MKGLLVHGCYDPATFRTLCSLGVESFAFDLRGRSTNLVTHSTLIELLKLSPYRNCTLIFADDSRETVTSYLDLLKDCGKEFLLEFRDKRPADYYKNLGVPFVWYFSPDADWKDILSAPNCRGVILPLKFQDLYRILPEMWAVIEENHLQIWLHAENFSEAEFFEGKKNIQASLDLPLEIHSSYRNVDQSLLASKKIWRKINESAAGQ